MRRLVVLAALGTALWLGTASSAHAQRFVVEPYLEAATPTSMGIAWETSYGEETVVEWGATRLLGMITHGETRRMRRLHRLHEVPLRGLAPGSRYFYRVRTGSLVSPISSFRTLPRPESEASVRILAMSDMQEDPKRPGEYASLIERGVLPYVAATYDKRPSEALNMVLLAGDLVKNGLEYHRWSEQLFAPMRELAREVPLFPVLGNHEEDSHHYFDYFRLPANGSPAYPEHWWWTDVSNVRVIGLDSNEGYRNDAQLAWLERTLDDACRAEHVDFVIAATHHPGLSELWRKGETAYSARIEERLRAFARSCNKPTLHVFGHTHGYARGHDRDDALTLVDVASAGGDLDEFGEYVQIDYPEYVVSQDEYGFVVVEADAGEKPELRLRRVSRGNPKHPRDNEIRDELVLRRHNRAPSTPVAAWPRGDTLDKSCGALVRSSFSDADGDAYGATHWQIAGESCDFEKPVVDVWSQYANYFRGVDTLHGDDGTRLPVRALSAQKSYCYRVRVRDRALAWSEWSAPERFRIAPEAPGSFGSCGPSPAIAGSEPLHQKKSSTALLSR